MGIKHDRIRQRRLALNFTLKELSEAVDVSESTMQRYEQGKIKNIKHENINKLAEALRCSPAYLMGWESNVYADAPQSTGGKWIPVLGTIAAGIPVEAIEDILDWEEIPHSLAKTGEFFALKIKGDSMTPTLVEGEVVIIKQQSDVESGDIAAVIINGEEATIKKIKKQLGGMVLAPSNPEYSPIYFTNREIEALPVQILGKVVESRKKF